MNRHCLYIRNIPPAAPSLQQQEGGDAAATAAAAAAAVVAADEQLLLGRVVPELMSILGMLPAMVLEVRVLTRSQCPGLLSAVPRSTL